MTKLTEPVVVLSNTYEEALGVMDGVQAVFRVLRMDYGDVTTRTTPYGVEVTFHPAPDEVATEDVLALLMGTDQDSSNDHGFVGDTENPDIVVSCRCDDCLRLMT